MTRLLLIIVALVSGLFLLPRPAFAEQDSDFTAGPYYERLVETLMATGPNKYFNYSGLRNYYYRSRQYAPIGDDIKEELLNLAYTVQTSKDRQKARMALEDYKTLLRQHMGHVGILMQAATLARQDRRFGDPEFYRQLLQALMKNVMVSGDGLTLRTAYQVITLDEEVMLLQALNVRVVESQTEKSGAVYYNMHSVFDRKTNKPYTVFVNLTRPMRFLEREDRQDNSKAYDIRKR